MECLVLINLMKQIVSSHSLPHTRTVRLDTESRFQRLVNVMLVLERLNEQHQQIVHAVRRERRYLEFPDLFVQMFQLEEANEQMESSQ